MSKTTPRKNAKPDVPPPDDGPELEDTPTAPEEPQAQVEKPVPGVPIHNLAALVNESKRTAGALFPFDAIEDPGDFKVQIAPADVPEINRLMELHSYLEKNPKTGQMETKLDTEEYNKAVTLLIVKGWEGLTLRIFLDLVVGADAALELPPGANMDSLVGFNEQNLVYLAGKSVLFSEFVTRAIATATSYREMQRGRARGNS